LVGINGERGGRGEFDESAPCVPVLATLTVNLSINSARTATN
jgi:hypothetical protein